jgi:two-component system sensor histidine kinase ResE
MSRLILPFRHEKEIEPVIFRRLPGNPVRRPWYFVSLRWKAIYPLAMITLAVAMTAAYLVSGAVARGAEDRQIDRLLRSSRAVADRMGALSTTYEREVTRIAFTQGVSGGIGAGDARTLHALLEPLAAAADLDYLIAADAEDREVLGLQRVVTADGAVDYAVATGTDLSASLASHGTEHWATIALTGQDYALLVAGPVLDGDRKIGTVLAGVRLDRTMDLLRGGDGIDLALFGAEGRFLRTTLPFDEQTRDTLPLSPDAFAQALSTPGQVPVDHLAIHGTPYGAGYVPLVIAGTPLGVAGTYMVEDTPYATWFSRDLMSLFSAAMVGLIVIATFAVVGRITKRLERVTRTAHALAAGDAYARTRMRPGDEIGELGATLDRLAERHQHRTDALEGALRRQRVETAQLLAVLESIPDGLVVQDLDGRVLLINDAARELLGGQRVFRSTRLHELTSVVMEKLGPTLAPGIYALGDPTQIALDGKMLQAQAAAITVTWAKRRIGTVIVLHDITADVVREQTRDRLLDRLTEQAVAPASPQAYTSLATLAQQVVRNTRAIQRVIAELRDLSTVEPRDLQTGQRPLPVNELLWHVAAEWDPLARIAGTRLGVKFGPRGQYVLGDDRRLRWAIGNVIDNALKYSPPGTPIEVRAHLPFEAPNTVEIAVEDQGYGIAPEDLDDAFTRFYRGTPRDPDGRPVRKPGTGQGLFIAQRVIAAHGGTIRIASRVGAGTTVVIRLPLTAPVTLEMPATDEPGAAVPVLEEVELSRGENDTTPLEPRPFPWRRRR